MVSFPATTFQKSVKVEFHLFQQHPEWTLQQYADAVGCSQSMVCTWRQRFREAQAQGTLDASIFFSCSRAPHHHPPRIDSEVKERVLSIRQSPPEPLQRTPGPLAILYYLQRDEALQAKAVRLPRSTRTIWRILDAAGAIERDAPRQRSPRLPRAPLEEVQLDFKDVCAVSLSMRSLSKKGKVESKETFRTRPYPMRKLKRNKSMA